MTDQILEWQQRLDQTSADFTAAFGALDAEGLNWRPDVHTWSIAQNIEHLIAINGSYVKAVAQLHDPKYQPPFVAKIGFLVRFFGNTILKASQPDTPRKMKTFPAWTPASDIVVGEDLWARWARSHNDLKGVMEEAEPLLARQMVISSPLNRNLVYYLSTAFEIIVVHERRHLAQAQRVLSQWEAR